MAENNPLTEQQLTELTGALQSLYAEWDESKVSDIFRLLDRDGNGTISSTELKTVLAQVHGAEDAADIAKELILDADTNGDGVIQLTEFFEVIRKNAP